MWGETCTERNLTVQVYSGNFRRGIYVVSSLLESYVVRKKQQKHLHIRLFEKMLQYCCAQKTFKIIRTL